MDITKYKYLRAGRKSKTPSYNVQSGRCELGVSVYPISWETDADGDTVCVIGDGSVHMTCMIVGYADLDWHLVDGVAIKGVTGGDNEPLIDVDTINYGPKYTGYYRFRLRDQ